jgi:2-methylcitrate dehydratase PrpD
MQTEDSQVSPELTQTLAEFAARLRYEDIPGRTREWCKVLFVDAVACALAGYDGEDTAAVVPFAAALGQSRESSVIGGAPLSLTGATALNGFLITAISLCDVYRPTATHLQPVVIPPVLAIAERDDCSGKDVVTALAVGFEVATRIGAGLDYAAFRRRGWHGPGTIGPFGAAAAAGRLLRLDAARMAAALGLAGSQSAGTFAAWGTSSVKFHQFRGALSGLFAALLAANGFSATRQFLTASDGGFYSTYSGATAKADAAAALGSRWELEQIALRPWPTSAANQGMVSALLELIQNHSLTPDAVGRLRIYLSEASYRAYVDRRTIGGKWEASGSVYYTAAVVLHDRTLWMDQYQPKRFNDPAVRRFALEQVELVSDPALHGVQAVVEADLNSGSKHRVRCDEPRGTPENPMTRAEVEEKFHKGARERLSRSCAEAALDLLWRVEELTSIRPLMAAQAVAETRAESDRELSSR